MTYNGVSYQDDFMVIIITISKDIFFTFLLLQEILEKLTIMYMFYLYIWFYI